MIKIPRKTKLNYRFHDPNPPDVMADYIAKIFIEANKGKIDHIIMEKTQKADEASLPDQSRYVS